MDQASRYHGNQDYFYENFYMRTIGNQARGIRRFLWKYPHRLIERHYKTNQNLRILEVGAGNGEHLPFVTPDFDSYTALDLRLSASLIPFASERIHCIQGDVTDLNEFQDSSFDRVIATCLIAHLEQPEAAMREIRRVVKNNGMVQLYMPCEPGFLLSIFRKLVTAPAVKRMGFSGFDLFMAREHRNSLPNLLTQAHYIFREDKLEIAKRPFSFLGWYLNLFYLVSIQIRKG